MQQPQPNFQNQQPYGGYNAGATYDNQQNYQGANQGGFNDQQNFQGANQGGFNNQQNYPGANQGGFDQNYAQPVSPNNNFGQQGNPNAIPLMEDSNLSRKLSDSTRLGFIRKVYLILMTQLCITAIGVTISVQIPSFKTFFNDNIVTYFISLIMYVVTVILLGCYKSIARKVPLNYNLLLLLTLSMTYMV